MSEIIKELLKQINQSWLDNCPEDMEPLLHNDIVMVLPGFSERFKGKNTIISGFKDFSNNSKISKFKQSKIEVDVIGKTAVATYSFTMFYERNGKKYESDGRDLWIFALEDNKWKAVWRTMLYVKENEMKAN